LLDDLDKTSTGEWAMGKLFGLINYRYERQKPIIITANRGIDELQASWRGSNKQHVADAGMAILSRIMGQLWGVIEFNGQDQRITQPPQPAPAARLP
jgi:DNA replication protein DnaC